MNFILDLLLTALSAVLLSFAVAKLLSWAVSSGDLSPEVDSGNCAEEGQQPASVMLEEVRFRDSLMVQSDGISKRRRVKSLDDDFKVLQFPAEQRLVCSTDIQAVRQDDEFILESCELAESKGDDTSLRAFQIMESDANFSTLVRQDDERAAKEGISSEIGGFDRGMTSVSELASREEIGNSGFDLVNETGTGRDGRIGDEGDRHDGLELCTGDDIVDHNRQERHMEFEEKSRELIQIGAEFAEIGKEGGILDRGSHGDCSQMCTANDVVDHDERITSVKYGEREERIAEKDADALKLDTAKDVADHDEQRRITELSDHELKEERESQRDEVRTSAIEEDRGNEEKENKRVEGEGEIGLELDTAKDIADHDEQGRITEFSDHELKEERESQRDEVRTSANEEDRGTEEKENRGVEGDGEIALELDTAKDVSDHDEQGRITEFSDHELKEERESQGDVVRTSAIEEGRGKEEKENRGVEGEGEIGDDEWEGIERSELEKDFAKATNFVEYGIKEGPLAKAGSDLIIQLHALQKVAIQGACPKPQPMTLMFSARAKWNAWQKLGSMSPEEAMGQYINLLSDSVPGWMEDHSVEEERLNLSGAGMESMPDADFSSTLTYQSVAEHERKPEGESLMDTGDLTEESIR